MNTLTRADYAKMLLVLAPREIETLKRQCDGAKSNVEVGLSMGISEASVRLYGKRIRAKLGGVTMMQAAVIAAKADLV